MQQCSMSVCVAHSSSRSKNSSITNSFALFLFPGLIALIFACWSKHSASRDWNGAMIKGRIAFWFSVAGIVITCLAILGFVLVFYTRDTSQLHGLDVVSAAVIFGWQSCGYAPFIYHTMCITGLNKNGNRHFWKYISITKFWNIEILEKTMQDWLVSGCLTNRRLVNLLLFPITDIQVIQQLSSQMQRIYASLKTLVGRSVVQNVNGSTVFKAGGTLIMGQIQELQHLYSISEFIVYIVALL